MLFRSGGAQGQATEIEIHAREILRIRQEMNEVLAKHTGQSVEKIAADTERDHYLSSKDPEQRHIRILPGRNRKYIQFSFPTLRRVRCGADWLCS